MASYTDTPLTASSFRPYVQQLPVEAMVNVGTTLQGRYNEGVQRIQSQIDRIAGLSIMRDVDKQYLQSKMSQLGTQLRMVSMGDFSNYQLVNSVTGMVGQVGKDKNIQNAVMSTATHQKQQAQIDDDRKNGKIAPENEYDYNKQLSAYMNSTKVGELFTGRYTPYTDVNKKLYEIGKEVGLDEKTVQELFMTDDNGTPRRYESDTRDELGLHKKGDIMWNPVMAEKHLKGKDPAKILDAFQRALTPADYNQLAITGRYVKANMTPDDLKKEIMTGYADDISSIDTRIGDLKIKLTNETSQNKGDDAAIESIKNQIDQLTAARTKLISSRDTNIAQVDSNPDAVRASLYTNRYLTGMAKDLSSLTEETTYKRNPHFDVMLDLNKFAFDQEKFRVQNAHWEYEQRQEEGRDKEARERWELEMRAKYPGMFNKGLSGTEQPIPTEGAEAAIANSLQEKYNADLAEMNKNNYSLAFTYNKGLTPTWTDAQVDQAMRRNAEAKKQTIDEYTAEFAAKQIKRWKNSPEGIPAEKRGKIARQYELIKSLSIQKGQIEFTEKGGRRRANEKGINVPTQEEIERNVRESTVVIDGIPVKLSKVDVIDFAQVHPEAFDAFASWRLGNDVADQARQSSEKRLIAKFGLPLFMKIEKEVFGYDRTSTLDRMAFYLPGSYTTRVGLVNKEINDAGNYLQTINYNALQSEKAKIIVENGFISKGLAHPLIRGDEKEDDFRRRIYTVVSKYDRSKDYKDIMTAISSEKVDNFKVVETPGIGYGRPTSYTFNIGTEGNEYSLDITPEDFTQLSGMPPAAHLQAPDVLKQVNMYGNSGLKGIGNGSDAYFSMSDFTNLKDVDYTVNGDLVRDEEDPTKVWFKIHKYECKTCEPKTLVLYGRGPGFNDDGSVAIFVDGSYNMDLGRLPMGVNDAVIQQMEKQRR